MRSLLPAVSVEEIRQLDGCNAKVKPDSAEWKDFPGAAGSPAMRRAGSGASPREAVGCMAAPRFGKS